MSFIQLMNHMAIYRTTFVLWEFTELTLTSSLSKCYPLLLISIQWIRAFLYLIASVCVAQVEVDTCLLNHLWELMQRARTSSKNHLHRETCGLQEIINQQQNKPRRQQGKTVDFSGLQPGRLFSFCIFKRNADKPWKTERAVCAPTGPQQAFQVLISCISD